MERPRVALKFLTFGMLVGVLFAPRTGSESREKAVTWLKSVVSNVVDGGSADRLPLTDPEPRTVPMVETQTVETAD